MNRTEAMAWVLWVCQDTLRRSQAKTLSVLVAATLGSMRLTLAGIGRELAFASGGAAKHAIKRAWRFVANGRVEPVEVMLATMNRLMQRRLRWHARRPERRPLLISLDWTKVRRFHVLMAAVVVDGRALPLCWASYADRVQGRSQNALEEAMLLRVRAALPEGVRAVILADRGFGRAELVRSCQRLGLDYLVRVRGDVQVRAEGGRSYSGLLEHYPIRRGQCHSFAQVTYRSDGVVRTNLVIRWACGLPRRHDGPWYLVTSLAVGRGRARRLSDLYKMRFDIEELFRDTKNAHRGWSLAKTQLTRADRLDRLILIAALAYVPLTALGLWCRARLAPKQWCTNRRRRELSAFAIARVMLHRTRCRLNDALDLLQHHLTAPQQNWG